MPSRRLRLAAAAGLFLGFPALGLGTAPVRAGAVPPGFVYAQGTQLFLDGVPFHFKGFNIYQANSTGNCSYSMQDPILSRNLHAIGTAANAIRSWFYQDLVYSGGRSAPQWAPFDRTLSDAAAAGDKVIVTIGDEWGTCERPDRMYKDTGWYLGGYKQILSPHESYRAWVQEIVSRYRHNPTVLAWQLMNEAEAQTNGAHGRRFCDERSAERALYSWGSDMASVVKRIDPYHLLSFGTMGGRQCGAYGADYQALHSINGIDLCEYHDYGDPDNAFPGDAVSGLLVRLTQCGPRGVNKPLFVGETGVQPDHSVAYVADQPYEVLAGSDGCSESNESISTSCPLDGVPCVAPIQTACRASDIQQKFEAQFAAGVVGELLWAWCDASLDPGCRSPSRYDVASGDPVVTVMAGFFPRV